MEQDATYYCAHCGAAYTQKQGTCFACGHPLTESADTEEQGIILAGRYKLLEQVGIGGFGAVYKALDMDEHNRVVAVKQINLRTLSPQEMIEATDSFNREVQFLSTLSHRHLPRVYAHFTDSDHWYLVMQFIEGETLEHYIRDTTSSASDTSRPLPFDEVLEMARQLCSVLFYLHNRQPPVIYRDLKPANIMRTPGGRLYLIDFGIARTFKPGQKKDTIPLGSPGYAAPEQYGSAQTTPRADIYSLGVLLYQLISGQNPAEHTFTFAPLQYYEKGGGIKLEGLIMKMVDIDVEKRPSTIAAVATAIKNITAMRTDFIKYDDYSGHQTPPSGQHYTTEYYDPAATTTGSAGQQQQQMQSQSTQPTQNKPGMSRRRLIQIFGATTSLLLVGNGLLHLLASSSQSSDKPHSVPPQAISLSPFNLKPITYQTNTHIQKVLFSPGSTQWATLGQSRSASVIAIYDATNQFPVTTSFAVQDADHIHSLSWSMDEKYLLACSGKNIYILPLVTQNSLTANKPLRLPLPVASPIATLQCSPANHTFFIMSTDGHIQVFHATDAKNLTQWQQSFPTLNDGQKSDPQQNQKLATWAGDQLAYVDHKNRVVLHDINTSAIQHYTLSPSSNFTTIASGPIGPGIVLGTQTGQVYMLDTANNTIQSSPPTKEAITDISWYPPYYQLVAATKSGILIWNDSDFPLKGLMLHSALSIASISATQNPNFGDICLLSANNTNTFTAWQVR